MDDERRDVATTSRYRVDRRPITELPKGPNGRRLCRECNTEVERPRISFCSDACVESYNIKSGRGLRYRVYDRDKGVCALCGTKCGWDSWHADHIVPVVDGGGGCTLENIRTLCVPCHKQVTAEWRRARTKKAAAQ